VEPASRALAQALLNCLLLGIQSLNLLLLAGVVSNAGLVEPVAGRDAGIRIKLNKT
jgi:hypothetical protein